jgi:DNA-binding transcriptional ArsR family regulator
LPDYVRSNGFSRSARRPNGRDAASSCRVELPLDNILVISKILPVQRAHAIAHDPKLLTAVASPRRQEILRLLWTGERAAGDLNQAFPDVTFGAVSLQLRVLREAGLVTVRSAGRQRFYRVQRDRLGPLAGTLETMWSDALWKLKLHAEFEATRRGPRPRRRARDHREKGVS